MKKILLVTLIISFYPSFGYSKDYYIDCPKEMFGENKFRFKEFEFHIEDNFFGDKAFYKLSKTDRWREASKIEISKREFIIHGIEINFAVKWAYAVINRNSNHVVFYSAQNTKSGSTMTLEIDDHISSKQCLK